MYRLVCWLCSYRLWRYQMWNSFVVSQSAVSTSRELNMFVCTVCVLIQWLSTMYLIVRQIHMGGNRSVFLIVHVICLLISATNWSIVPLTSLKLYCCGKCREWVGMGFLGGFHDFFRSSDLSLGLWLCGLVSGPVAWSLAGKCALQRGLGMCINDLRRVTRTKNDQ